jgi:hypothetical protein
MNPLPTGALQGDCIKPCHAEHSAASAGDEANDMRIPLRDILTADSSLRSA